MFRDNPKMKEILKEKRFSIITSLVIAFVMIGATVYFAAFYEGNEPEEFYNIQYVSGTEYYFGDEGEVAVELFNMYNSRINATCYATAYYPNKTKLFSNQTMSVNSGSGVYYYQFTVPNSTGVFEYGVNCYWESRMVTRSKSWHVSNSTQTIRDDIEALKTLKAVLAK